MSTTVFVATLSAGKAKWSRYLYPFSIDAFAQLGDHLYIRAGDTIRVVDPTVATDLVAGIATNFPGTVQWGWLDAGQAGTTKMMEGIDYIGTGQGPSLSIGYDQRNLALFTAPYLLANDTLPGGIIPLPVSGPTLSVKLDFVGGAAWQVQEVILYLDDNRSPS
jgi:hypothetical protein